MGETTSTVPNESSCDPTNTNNNCSSSAYCQCEQTSTGKPICTQQMNCDYAAQCDANDSCEKSGSICVLDSRCPGKRLCYSTVLFSSELCPAPGSQSQK